MLRHVSSRAILSSISTRILRRRLNEKIVLNSKTLNRYFDFGLDQENVVRTEHSWKKEENGMNRVKTKRMLFLNCEKSQLKTIYEYLERFAFLHHPFSENNNSTEQTVLSRSQNITSVPTEALQK